jgi:hypothetical protein
MATDRQTVQDPASAGREALAHGAWERAREHFEAALEREESGEAWEGLGWAGWWMDDEELTMRAYRCYRAAGYPGGAARVAAWLAADHREFRGEDAVGRAWLLRARRLLEAQPESADHGWLALIEANFALNVDGIPSALSRSPARRRGSGASSASPTWRRWGSGRRA